ncbi:MAG TPA: extensin family protein, partial [Sandaracinaceae bacterium LLY-WYZ-13_1]|nr:extensin family protein [Sandaracinaceae bacterium LLY-WYZ-13_1]
RRYPLLVMLHGGSSNGNLFLGVVLGNNMDWERYSQFLWNDFTPRWSPDWIVVAPDGVGQVIWRWMGEQDVLEVVEDVQRHYAVDPQRVVLGGLSNGGMGAHSVGMRHAWRFAHVQAIAGAPSWVQYAGGRPTDEEEHLLRRYSAMSLIENSINTDYHFYHGTQDPGPMRPRFIRRLSDHMEEIGLDPEPHEHWYDFGHDLLYLVHRHGRVYPELAEVVRDPRPEEVVVVTGDYRANRQHWLTVTRIERYPELARVEARAEAGRVAVTTDNALELALDLRTAPVGRSGETRIEIDGAEVYDGPRAHLGHVVHVARNEDGAWSLGFLPEPEALEKVPGLSGPIGDAYHDEIVHVYGTGDAETEDDLRRTAERGANGWPMGVWYLNQRVIPDTEVTDALMREHHLALYGSPGENAVLDRIMQRLPIRVEDGAVVTDAGDRFAGRDVGARFVYPNPEAPGRYVLVHTGVTADAVEQTRKLPDFLPDYVVYDRRTTRGRRPRLIAGRRRPLAAGFFDRFWRLAPPTEEGAAAPDPDEADDDEDERARRPLPDGVSPEEMRRLALQVGAPEDFILPSALFEQTPAPELEPGEVPSEPPRPRRFLAPRDDPNGLIARRIARLVPTFYNYRAIIPGGTWHTGRRSQWKIRPEADCLAALDEAEVPYRRVTEDLETPTPTPVEITGPVNEVGFATVREEDPIVLSCEMAARLPLMTRIAGRQGVRRIVVLSSHRTRPRQSFHRMGMALDLFAFDTDRGRMSVLEHFVETPAHTTCDAPAPDDWRAARLLRIACGLARTRRFSSVLTPNYNDGHRNHFHVDIRPDDDRVFVR